MLRRIAVACVALLIFARPGAAQEADTDAAQDPDTAAAARVIPLDSLVVTVARRPQRLAEVPVATELISRREIERTGASNVAAVLTERAGIVLQGGHPVGAGVMLQGLGSERVLILVDGQPFIGRIAGGIDLSRLPTSMIRRIEVVKGPMSALYGSEAMGSVVNIITRRAERDGWRAGSSVMIGSRERRDAALHVSGGVGPVGVLLSLGRRDVALTPGRAETAGARAERCDASAELRWRPNPSLTVTASALLLDERQRWRSGQLWHFAHNRQWSARLTADWTWGAHRLSPTIYALPGCPRGPRGR